jgi:uncharacterized protein (TIGR02453 family)
MAWFEKKFIQFFKELENNNHREWFHSNKKRYEEFVKIPFYDFVGEMIRRIQADDATYAIDPKDAIFRINRDIRFSPDKRPYKTKASAIISPGGRKNFNTPGIYFEFKADGIQFYGGAHHIEKDQLERVRNNIAKSPGEFNRIINAADFSRHFNEVLGEKNKRIPKELQEAAKKQPLIFNKNYYYGKKMAADLLLKDELPDKIFELYLVGKPFNMFFREAMN